MHRPQIIGGEGHNVLGLSVRPSVFRYHSYVNILTYLLTYYFT